MNKRVALFVLIASGTVIAGCGTKGDVKPEAEGAVVEERAATGEEPGPGAEMAGEEQGRMPETAALPEREGARLYPLDDPDSILSTRTIYFDYDKSEVKEEFRRVVAAHAEFLAKNSRAKVVLEGHTDERGSREYNIGLGERRAEAVRRLLLFQGATDEQVRTVSYGEERPAVEGHDDTAWSKNRRVEIVYQR